MNNASIAIFRDPQAIHTAPLEMTVFKETSQGIEEGVFRSVSGRWYPILSGVPRFLYGELRPDYTEFARRHGLALEEAGISRPEAADQKLTNTTFSDKWRRFKTYGLEAQHQEFLLGWYCKKFNLSTVDELKAFYSSKKRVLEVGPGSGFNTKFIAENSPGKVFAVDISEAALTTYENTRELPNCTVVQADLMDTPFEDDFFDFIIADGVLHHTPNTRDAVRALYRKVKPGGEFFFYVYRKMGAARQFADAFIRESFTKLSPEECYAACEGLTELGRELSHLNVKIELKKPIPVLGIPSGTHDVQRLLYYNFVKCFWNDAFDYETNNMVNFDWYHPHNAWQHTEEEVAGWLSELGVKEFQFNNSNPNGISVLLKKPMRV